jgi:hypothetical protein
MATRMQQRRGTAAQWTAANPTLAAGEIGFETDTNKFKIGNGSSNWAALQYFANTAGLEALLNDGAPAALNTLNEIAAAINDDPAFFTTVGTNLTNHQNDTTGIHGIADTSLLETTSGSQAKANAAQDAVYAQLVSHAADSTNVHGVDDFSLLQTIAGSQTVANNAVSSHSSDTTSIHGIADTSLLATQEYVDDAVSGASVNQSTLAGVGIDWNGTTSQFDIDSTVATKTYADGAVSTHQSDTTNVHGIADTSLLALKSEVAAVTKTSLGLGNVDNTSDANKPVSTAQSTAIATAKSEAIADATSQVNALLSGAPAALNTLDELAAALGDDANFAASVTTSLGLKVDSLTPISQKTASYTLSSLTERDDLIEMGSASALTLTIPTDATLNFPIGTSIDILQTGAGQVTIAPVSGTVTVNGTPGLKLRTTWSSCTLLKRAANTWVVFGDLTA